MAKRTFPVVIGPGGGLYALDGHHWMRALHEEGVGGVTVEIVGDLSDQLEPAFWMTLQLQGWCRPFDADGRRIAPFDIPTSITALEDDPYRSLASDLKRAGFLKKTGSHYGEFECADALRCAIPKTLVQGDYDAALLAALQHLATGEAYSQSWPQSLAL